jgi:catalase
MRGTLKEMSMGRTIGMLIADGSDGAAIERVTQAATAAGASVKTIAPQVGVVTLADGSVVPADGHLAASPSVRFDALVVILSDEAARSLAMEGAAIDFVRDAFGHLKAIAADPGGLALLKSARVGRDAGVVAVGDTDAFMAAAQSRQWDRQRNSQSQA